MIVLYYNNVNLNTGVKMNRLSSNEKSKAFHRVYTLINYLDSKSKIERDPLHARYEVNKYGVRVKFDQKRWKSLMNEFIEKYSKEYELTSSVHSGCYENRDLGISLWVREQDMKYFGQDEVLVDIAIH